MVYVITACIVDNGIPMCSPVAETAFTSESWILHRNQCPYRSVTHHGDVLPQGFVGNVHQNTNNIALCVSNCRVHAASSRPVETDRVANYLCLEALLVIHWGVSFCTLGSERVLRWEENRCVLAADEMSGVPHQTGLGAVGGWHFRQGSHEH